jgi:peptidoglycan/xylan/chitin deacetylase (PgdA/CDA1 family)
MLILNKREFLARRLRDAGLLRFLERFATRPGLLVLTYHRIGDPASSPWYGPIYSASPESFRAQVRLLRDRYQLIGLADLERSAADGDLRFERPTILITFDDGYRDNVELALPILLEEGIPAAFFLATGFLGRSRPPWWDRVAFALKRTERSTIELQWPEPLTIDIEKVGRDRAIAAVIGAYLRADCPDDPAILDHLDDRVGVIGTALGSARDLFMTWDDARRLAEAGLGIGSHSVDHPRLARLSEAEQRTELVESRRRLEAELGRPIASVAYPYGGPESSDATTRRLASEAGYRLAFAWNQGVNRPGMADPLGLCRIGVGAADTPGLLRARTALMLAFGGSPL